MTRVTVIGGTGYAGAHIAALAAQRGHQVTVIARKDPDQPLDGVAYIHGSVEEPDILLRAFDAADVVVLATSPRGDMADGYMDLVEAVVEQAQDDSIPLIVVGGYSVLRPAEGEPRFIEGEIAEQYRHEATMGWNVLQHLMDADGLEWTYVSPAAKFGSWVEGEATGTYRLGGEVALVDDAGNSHISGADFALAVVDILDSGDWNRGHVSVAY